jgi:hypothetical protein
MNNIIERIKEECTVTSTSFYGGCGGNVTDSYFDHEKFAKLIVLECIYKIENYEIPVGNSAAGEMACEWTYDALEQIRADIIETFGVVW